MYKLSIYETDDVTFTTMVYLECKARSHSQARQTARAYMRRLLTDPLKFASYNTRTGRFSFGYTTPADGGPYPAGFSIVIEPCKIGD